MAVVPLGPRSLLSVSAMKGESPFLGAHTLTCACRVTCTVRAAGTVGPGSDILFQHLFFFLVDDLFFSDYKSNACLMGKIQRRIREKIDHDSSDHFYMNFL